MATNTASSVVKGGFYKGVSLFFEYDTPKIVHIKSKKVGIINRIIQLVILAYVIGYVIVWEKGYQEFDTVVSAASTKVKGVTYTNLSELERPGISDRLCYSLFGMLLFGKKDTRNLTLLYQQRLLRYVIVWEKGYQEFDTVVSAASTKVKGVTYTNLSELERPGISDRLWDPADYVNPPQENNAFFVMTNAIVTLNQSQGVCAEDPSHENANCTTDNDCTRGEYVSNGNGIRTGKCNVTAQMCEIRAWCPVEKDNDFPLPGQPLLDNSDTFTVLIKNQIEFPKFNKKRRNILDTYNKTYLSSCRYNKSDEYDRFCPIFGLGYIVHEAGQNYTALATFGGFILINIQWNCDLDHSIDKCVPKYTFRRLDDENSPIAKGWNFRYANYYYESGTEYRDLIKAYGIRFIIEVTGEAGKFSAVPLFMNLGSGLALLAVATVLCDMITLYLLKKGDFYKEKKYLFVEGDDAFKAVYEDPAEESSSQSRQPQPSEKLTDDASAPNSYQSTGETQAENEDQNGVNRRNRPGQYNRMEDED